MKRFGKTVTNLWILIGLVLMAAVSFADENDIEACIVQVIVTFQEHDSSLPWKKRRPGVRSGYGVIIGNSQVVTTESLVRNHKLVELRRVRKGEKITAAVEMSDCQVNLALLKIPSGTDAAAIVPMRLAETVPGKAEVEIVQFDETAQTQRGDGRVSQIAVSKLPKAPYRSLVFNLMTDMSVNGEGAAVIYEGRLAGLIMRYNRNTQTGSMLPYPVLRHFLNDAAELPYRGFACAGFLWTSLVDPGKRAYLNVEHNGRGILVLSCLPDTGAFEALKPNDVILEWDGHVIDNLGFYEDPEFGRLELSYLIKGRREPGDVVPVTIIRDRSQTTVNLELGRRTDSANLIPENVTGEQAEYLVNGGFIIRELTGRYLHAGGGDWKRTVDPRLVHLYLTRRHITERPGDRVVILSGVLPDPINIGYQHHFHNTVITSLNGRPVRNMADVFRVVDRDRNVMRLTLQSVGVELVLDQEELAAANSRLKRLYRLPKFRYQRDSAWQATDD